MQNETTQQTFNDIQEASKNLYRDLGVPSDALNVDVLMMRYKVKNNEVAPVATGLCDFINLETKVYVKDGQLCISDIEHTYALPLDGMRCIRCVSKRVSIPSWNKKIGFDQGIYKPYKMAVNNMGILFFKPYYILECEIYGEVWGLYFPCYELPAISSLTGLSPDTV